MTPDDRLRECVYKALSVPDKIKYIEEIRTTANYEMQIERWQKGNKSGPRPLKPGTTHQDRFESKLQTAKRVIETQVRQSMTEDERNAYDCAKALCEKQIAAKSDYHFFYWPDEIIQYNKRIAKATGLKTESEEVFFRRN